MLLTISWRSTATVPVTSFSTLPTVRWVVTRAFGDRQVLIGRESLNGRNHRYYSEVWSWWVGGFANYALA